MVDQFDPNFHHKKWKLSSNNSIVTKQSDEHDTCAYLTKICKSGVNKWRFKLKTVNTNGYDVLIGVWKTAQQQHDISADLVNIKNRFYGFKASAGESSDGNGKWSNYAINCKTGDVIDMILDLNKAQLSFIINGTDYGVCQKVEKTSYVAVVSAYTKSDCIKLISFNNNDNNNDDNDDIKCNKCDELKHKTQDLTSKLSIKDGTIQSLNDVIANNEKVNIELKRENADKTDKFERMQQKYNKMNEANIKLKEENDKLTEKYNKINESNIKLKENYNKINESNIKLNEECKELHSELTEMKEKYNKLYRKMNIKEEEYMSWNSDNITDWIINLDAEYEKYEEMLRKNLSEEQVDGELLATLDKNDIHRIGIKPLKHKNSIIAHIKRLTTKKQQLPQNDEGNNATLYI